MATSPAARIVFGVLCVAGCGGAPEYPPASRAPLPPAKDVAPAVAAAPAAQADGGEVQIALNQSGTAAAGANEPRLQRQIIYDAVVRIVVEDFTDIPQQVEKRVKEAGGFVAHAKVQGLTGRPRSGEWKIRLPLAGYSTFLDQARSLGELQSLSADSQDVTEQYYDLDSRIRNKEREEARLLKHLEESTGKLAEILTVEKEISRVREELERMQGRLRVLQDLVSLATVTLHVDEIKGYVPTQNPTFGVRISRAFDQSWAALVATSQTVAVAGVAIAPWAVALGIPGIAFILVIRRLTRRRVSTVPPAD